MTAISRRVFLVAGALSAGTALLPEVARADLPQGTGDVYVLTDTLVLRAGDIVKDVTLVWAGPADRAMVRIEGAAALQGCVLRHGGDATTFVQLAAWEGVVLEDLILERIGHEPLAVY